MDRSELDEGKKRPHDDDSNDSDDTDDTDFQIFLKKKTEARGRWVVRLERLEMDSKCFQQNDHYDKLSEPQPDVSPQGNKIQDANDGDDDSCLSDNDNIDDVKSYNPENRMSDDSGESHTQELTEIVHSSIENGPNCDTFPKSVDNDREISELDWTTYNENNLNYGYTTLYSESEADELFERCERDIVYNTGKQAQVTVFGKVHNIPRKQVAFGDSGLFYTFSGCTVPANPWPDFLSRVRRRLEAVCGQTFNFLLVNRYKDGDDHIGEHKDDENDLMPRDAIALLSLGEPRDFIFKHEECRQKPWQRSGRVDRVVLNLGHGSLLLMKHPTNRHWLHSVPKRKHVHGVRVSFTFRHMVMK